MLSSLSPFRNQLFDGDVGPQLSGEAREGVLLLGQLGVQLRDVGLGLQGDVQAGLQRGTGQRTLKVPFLPFTHGRKVLTSDCAFILIITPRLPLKADSSHNASEIGKTFNTSGLVPFLHVASFALC